MAQPDVVLDSNKSKHWGGRSMQVKEQCPMSRFSSFLHIQVAVLHSLNITSANNTLISHVLMVYYNQNLILYSLFIPIISGN